MDKIIQINDEIKRLQDEKRAIVEQERLAKLRKMELQTLNEDAHLANKFVNGLYKQRIRLGLSQTNLAKATGVSRQMIHNFETGKNMPSLEKFLRLNEVLKYWKINPLLEEPNETE